LPFAAHEGEPPQRVDEQRVIVVAAVKRKMADDAVRARVDDGDVVPRLDVP
jgi:hypothetical protein